MVIYDFIRKGKKEWVTLVKQHGRFLLVQIKFNYRVVLYYMDEFFAEIWYNPEDNKIEHVLAFKSLSRLDPYLNLIKLPDVLR